MSGLLLALLLAVPASAQGPAAPARPVRNSDQDRRRALNLFDLLVEDGRLSEAEAFLDERYSLGLDTGPWTLRRARLRGAQRRHAEQAELLRGLLASNPGDSGLMVQLALAEQAAGRVESAKQGLEAARARSSDPSIPYHLSELAFSRGRPDEGRRWAQAALEEIPPSSLAADRRMRLRLRARLSYDDAVDSEFGTLADRATADPEVLFDWASALLRAGAPEEAAEPLSLLAERFPDKDLERRRLESERLRLRGDLGARDAFVRTSLALYPDEPDFLYPAAESAFRRRRWAEAEELSLRVSTFPAYAAAGSELLEASLERGRFHAGPRWRWRESEGTRTAETGMTARFVPAPGWRAAADAGWARHTRRSNGASTDVGGLSLEAARDEEAWEAGADLDIRSGGVPAAASPGLFAVYRPDDRLALQSRAWARRLWEDSAEAAVAGVFADGLDAAARWRPRRRLQVGLQGRWDRLSARSGGRGAQTSWGPEASLILVDRPFYAAVGWRHSAVDASGDASFFSALPLLTRSRIHYATLNAGSGWRGGRLRADASLFNGHEPERGRRFFSGDLFGFGVSAQALVGRWTLAAGYDLTVQQTAGVGGRSHSARASVTRRFGGPR